MPQQQFTLHWIWWEGEHARSGKGWRKESRFISTVHGAYASKVFIRFMVYSMRISSNEGTGNRPCQKKEKENETTATRAKPLKKRRSKEYSNEIYYEKDPTTQRKKSRDTQLLPNTKGPKCKSMQRKGSKMHPLNSSTNAPRIYRLRPTDEKLQVVNHHIITWFPSLSYVQSSPGSCLGGGALPEPLALPGTVGLWGAVLLGGLGGAVGSFSTLGDPSVLTIGGVCGYVWVMLRRWPVIQKKPNSGMVLTMRWDRDGESWFLVWLWVRVLKTDEGSEKCGIRGVFIPFSWTRGVGRPCRVPAHKLSIGLTMRILQHAESGSALQVAFPDWWHANESQLAKHSFVCPKPIWPIFGPGVLVETGRCTGSFTSFDFSPHSPPRLILGLGELWRRSST